jgi:Transcriptional regulator, AbiEi antitoxin
MFMIVYGESRSDWEALVSAQAGIATHVQARQAGFSDRQITYRLSSGKWQRVHRGVYATCAGPLPRAARLWAALLWAGEGAVLSHETALEVAELTDEQGLQIHVTVPRRRRPAQGKPMPGVVVHRSDRARSVAHAPWQLPRTPVEDTVLDLAAATRTFDDAYAWISRALAGWQVPALTLRRAIGARTRFPHRAWFIDALDDAGQGVHSRIESRYVRDVERAHGLPTAGSYGVAVEFDGFEARRDLGLATRDVATLRVDLLAVTTGACASAVTVGAAMRGSGWPGEPHPCRKASCVLRGAS